MTRTQQQRRTSRIVLFALALGVACAAAGCGTDGFQGSAGSSAHANSVVPASDPSHPSVTETSAVETTAASEVSESTASSTTAPAPATIAVAPTTTLDPVTGFPTGVAGDIPNGSYRVDVTDADLAAVNIPPQNRPENEGTFTWTLTDGAWTNLQTADHPIQYPTASGVYIADGDHVTFFVASDLGPQEFTWKVEPNGDLILSAEPSTSGFYAAFLGAHPLVKVS